MVGLFYRILEICPVNAYYVFRVITFSNMLSQMPSFSAAAHSL